MDTTDKVNSQILLDFELIQDEIIYSLLRLHFQKVTRGTFVLYRSPECIGYAVLEQAWKCMTICCISFHSCRSIRKQILPSIKMDTINQVSLFELIW